MDLAPTETLERDRREPDRPPPAGGAAEIPGHIYRYVLATSGWHQLVLVGLTVAVFLLEVVPLELQRRIVDDLVKHRDFWFIITLSAVYLGTVLLQAAPSSSSTSIAAGSASAPPAICGAGCTSWSARVRPRHPRRRPRGSRRR